MATREDRVYNRLDEVGQNALLESAVDNSDFGNLSSMRDTGGGSGGSGGAGSSVGFGGGTFRGADVLAFDPYTSPYIQPRVLVFTINTYTSLSRKAVLAKAFLDGVEIEDQTNTKGRVTFTINEQRLLNPSTLTIVSGDLRAQKYFIIQSRKDVENEVSIIEVDNIVDASIPVPGTETPLPGGSGGGGFQDTTGGQFDGSGGLTTGGGGGFTGGGYEDGRGGLGRDAFITQMNEMQNIQ
jgi:hypothetical protein